MIMTACLLRCLTDEPILRWAAHVFGSASLPRAAIGHNSMYICRSRVSAGFLLTGRFSYLIGGAIPEKKETRGHAIAAGRVRIAAQSNACVHRDILNSTDAFSLFEFIRYDSFKILGMPNGNPR